MKEKSLELVLLFDFYAPLLTDKQREFFDLYYNEDLSLGEIAENAGITRQGVRDAIQRVETVLRETESRLHLAARFGRVSEDMEHVLERVQDIAILNATRLFDDRLTEDIEAIRAIAARLLEEPS